MQNPSLGHRRDDICLEEGVLFWPIGPSLLAYRVKGDRLEILAIERASRDWSSIFD